MLREMQKNEAIKRMEILNLHENVINEFKEENKLNKSRAGGTLFWLNDEEQKMVKKFEEESGNLVYHIIYNKMEFGELYTLFYITKNKKEWNLDRADLDNNVSLTYCTNTKKSLNEYGYIGFKRRIGGLVRVS